MEVPLEVPKLSVKVNKFDVILIEISLKRDIYFTFID